nr:aluminum-activated malate transporter 12-like [Tanacetum cinerariifolium]
TAATFVRFFPRVKKNYDYGVLIFLLTFNLITVSSYRVDDILKLAHGRISSIAIGCGVCMLMSLLILPNWSGEDLHCFTVSKIDGLAKAIEACAHHSNWEPRHSLHCHKFPGKQYVKLGGVLRHFGYAIVALHGSLETEIRKCLIIMPYHWSHVAMQSLDN